MLCYEKSNVYYKSWQKLNNEKYRYTVFPFENDPQEQAAGHFTNSFMALQINLLEIENLTFLTTLFKKKKDVSQKTSHFGMNDFCLIMCQL